MYKKEHGKRLIKVELDEGGQFSVHKDVTCLCRSSAFWCDL